VAALAKVSRKKKKEKENLSPKELTGRYGQWVLDIIYNPNVYNVFRGVRTNRK